MTFRVSILGRAERDFRSILSFIAERSKPGAVAWAKAFDAALARLEQRADSFPQAVENE
jgi:plasmid stabilization system protein ParE